MEVSTAASNTAGTHNTKTQAERQNSAATARLWRPLRLLTFYRLILTGLLAVLFFSLRDANPFNVSHQELFANTLLAYLGFSLVVGFSARLRWPGYKFQSALQILTDIVTLTILMYASDGIGSGLAVVMVVAVAAGGLLLPGRLAFLFAAIAALAVLAESSYEVLTLAKATADTVTRAGLLGMVMFTASGLAYMLAHRIRESEALAEKRGIDLANLEQLNQHVIQHLESGILVIDTNDSIRMSNTTAKKFLNLPDSPELLSQIHPELLYQLQLWRNDHSWRPENIHASGENKNITLMPRFSMLKTAQGIGTLVFLDDSNTLAEQSQQIKLASLGRLSASIAHEIRNPLGAISHAAQLLEESDQLDDADKRLIEIIDKHSQRVDTIIENILHLSRRKPVQPQRIELKYWLKDFITEFCESEKASADAFNLTIAENTEAVHMDPAHLHQVVWNLCKNGLRHAGSPAKLMLRVPDKEGQLTRLDIIDNGSGIPADKAGQIFEPFFTTESTGTGLGLYLARELCEINHCHLSYLPAATGGCCFRIHFAPQQKRSIGVMQTEADKPVSLTA
jgi:two-component system sensor histidine kinase PilS (NtrC family)